MRTVFADTLFWIALIRPRDSWRNETREALRKIGEARLLTTDEVLSEFLTAISSAGPILRQKAVETVHFLHNSKKINIIPQSRDSFLRAMSRYSARSDKAYSLTDCASMNAMDENGVREILTNDHHFEQEGYLVLINR